MILAVTSEREYVARPLCQGEELFLLMDSSNDNYTEGELGRLAQHVLIFKSTNDNNGWMR